MSTQWLRSPGEYETGGQGMSSVSIEEACVVMSETPGITSDLAEGEAVQGSLRLFVAIRPRCPQLLW